MTKVLNTYKGTMAELASKVLLNGKPLSQPFISQLVTYGIGAEKTGKLDNKAGKGKPINVVTLTSTSTLLFSEVEADAAPQADEAPQADTVVQNEGTVTLEANETAVAA